MVAVVWNTNGAKNHYTELVREPKLLNKWVRIFRIAGHTLEYVQREKGAVTLYFCCGVAVYVRD